MKKKARIDRRLLKKLRKDRGWSLNKAVGEIGCLSPQGLHNIEQGLVQPSVPTLVKLARVYGVSMDAFIPELNEAPSETR